MSEVISYIKYLRISPRKLREIVNMVKENNPKNFMEKLRFIPKRGAVFLAKAINSALANAINNFKINQENLRIKSIEINEGPRLKRWQPVARGAVHPYLKRTSHLKITLEEILPVSKTQKTGS